MKITPTAIIVDDGTEHAENVAEALRSRRDAVTRAAADQAAQEAAEAERERAALDALPVTDAGVDADPAVVALEQRVAAGDDEVTAAQLAEVRTAAAGRVRFGRLRRLAAERQARREAEQLERDQAAAAAQHAREQLAGYTPAALTRQYDAAVQALNAYVELLAARSATIRELALLPVAERPRGLMLDQAVGPHAAELDLDGVLYRREDIGTHVRQVLAAAGVLIDHGRPVRVADSPYSVDPSDPAVVAQGRAQLAEG